MTVTIGTPGKRYVIKKKVHLSVPGGNHLFEVKYHLSKINVVTLTIPAGQTGYMYVHSTPMGDPVDNRPAFTEVTALDREGVEVWRLNSSETYPTDPEADRVGPRFKLRPTIFFPWAHVDATYHTDPWSVTYRQRFGYENELDSDATVRFIHGIL